MCELAAACQQYIGNLIAHHHAAQGDVAVGNGFGEGHQVGLQVISLATKPVAGAAEAADDLIHDQQDVPLVADTLDLGPVSVRRDNYAAGALNRLGNKGRDIVLAQFIYLGLQLPGHTKPELLRTVVTAFRKPIGLVDVVNVIQAVGLFMHGAHAAQGGSGNG